MTVQKILVPDIGDFKGVEIIDVLVKAGDSVQAEDALITLETDKATMDVPSPFSGVLKEIKAKVGDKVSEGDLIALVEASEAAAATPASPKAAPAPAPQAAPARREETRAPAPASVAPPPMVVPSGPAHASPSVRRFARELGVNLAQVRGSSAKGRITKADVQNFVKAALAQPRGAGGLQIAEMPVVDFAKFGAVEKKPLSRIKKLSGSYLHRNWVSIPHVTQFDDADITDMEAYRKEKAAEYTAQGVKVTPLAFLLKASAEALRQFPDFNASLDASGENLILKKYIHIGVAVDTPDGLVVPVLRDVDKKSVVDLARELGVISTKAREKKLTAAEMQGGCFSISSLGGIGGTAFTPIINAPEVAILGVSRAAMKPVWKDGAFAPRLLLPLSLSYDHRVIDGAAGARFITALSHILADIRRLAG
ncbi:MAG: dihydrolipoyllysine-residue acetyltransferase [Gallionellaceae bacterium]|jgi:pyruvate dehydrogenase E2 component (dihydrolipoamide acetyltransferase)|nr:dihydrolipoyllysine-residue acetyltransferase [Gallionellaceae bacterium]